MLVEVGRGFDRRLMLLLGAGAGAGNCGFEGLMWVDGLSQSRRDLPLPSLVLVLVVVMAVAHPPSRSLPAHSH